MFTSKAFRFSIFCLLLVLLASTQISQRLFAQAIGTMPVVPEHQFEIVSPKICEELRTTIQLRSISGEKELSAKNLMAAVVTPDDLALLEIVDSEDGGFILELPKGYRISPGTLFLVLFRKGGNEASFVDLIPFGVTDRGNNCLKPIDPAIIRNW